MLDLPDLDWVVVDTETSGTHPDDGARVASVGLARTDLDWSLALPFDQGVRDKMTITQLDLFFEEDPNLPEAAWDELMEWLAGRDLVFHNAKYDLKMLEAGTRHWPGRDLLDAFAWDTMVAQRELDPREDVGLDKVVKRLGISRGKADTLDPLKTWLRKRSFPPHRYDLAPWSIVHDYVLSDVFDTCNLYLLQQERLDTEEERELLPRIQRKFDLLEALYRMEARGIGYDAARSREAAAELERRAAEIESRMPFKCDVNSAKRFFFEECGLEPDRRTEVREDPVLDEEQVRKWRAEGVAWADEYALVSKARRAVSMWYRGYPDKISLEDGRLRTDYKQTKVKSGRMSVGRVQLQAMPKSDKYTDVTGETLPIYEGIPGVRELLRAREGYGLWNLDLSQAELRVAAKYARCDRMLGMLLEGADLHGITCETVLGVSRDAPDWKTKRDIAKRLTFGSIFQIGGKTFQKTLSKLADIQLPLAECYDLVYNWRRMYPEFEVAYGKADQMAIDRRYVRLLPNTPYEVRSYFGSLDYTNTAWNRIVQGSLAEFFALWMVEVERQAPGYMVLTIHDSVLLECPLDEGNDISREVARRGTEMASELFKTPMKIDIDRYDVQAPVDKKTKDDDQYDGVK